MLVKMALGNKIKNDEDYKRFLKMMNIFSITLILTGLLLIGFRFFGEEIFKLEKIEGIEYYSGMGVGLILAGIILLTRNIVLIKNPNKLKEYRIKDTDERSIEINALSLRFALIGLFLSSIVILLTLGIKNTELRKVITYYLYSFVIIFFISKRILESKM